MSNPKRRLIFQSLLFSVISIVLSFCYQPNLAAWDFTAGGAAHDFAPGQLEKHYLKHGYQFGSITREQYLHEAQELLDAPPSRDVLEKIRYNGDVEHYRISTGEFAVMTKRGRIRTLYKTNYRHWMREINDL